MNYHRHTSTHALLMALGLVMSSMQAAAHDWYTGQQTLDGLPCCGDRDCRALTEREIRLSPAGEIEVLELGMWWPAIDERWYVGPSPDGSWHVCRPAMDLLPRCVFGGLGT